MSYQAIVCKVQTRPHPNAERLALGICQGNQVVVGLETQDGELGIYFDCDGQLSHEYCLNNGLYNNSARAKLGLKPAEKPGFFDHHRRVRAQSFRGAKSEGFFMPLSSLSWAGDISKLKEGDSFTEFCGYEICTKYLSPRTRAALGKAASQPKRENKCFPKHDISKQFRFLVNDIPEDAVIYVTEKLHGTQGRLANVLDDIEIGGVKRAINWAAKHIHIQPFPTKHYTHLNGSKNVILEKSTGGGWYNTNDFRYDVVEGVSLHKGEAIYFEIVGWVNETTPIMPPHDVSKTGLKDIQKQYGEAINYTYGCPVGEHRMYVYKILQTNEDGYSVDLSWPQVKARCAELGLAHVPQICGPVTKGLLTEQHASWVPPYDTTTFPELLTNLVEAVVEGESRLNPAQIREGVVVRVESSLGNMYLKHKGWAFKVLEGIVKENDSFVDPEDVA